MDVRTTAAEIERGGVVDDLTSGARIHDLVVDFYREIVFDDLLGPVFGEVAEVDWSVHIPKLIDYWCRVLLNEPRYQGFILGPHQRVHEVESFTLVMFDRWYSLFVVSVDRAGSGPNAEKAKAHAAHMCRTLARRLLDETWVPPEPV